MKRLICQSPKDHGYIEPSVNSYFVILSAAKDLILTCSYEILRSLRFLRMTGEGTFAEVAIAA